MWMGLGSGRTVDRSGKYRPAHSLSESQRTGSATSRAARAGSLEEPRASKSGPLLMVSLSAVIPAPSDITV